MWIYQGEVFGGWAPLCTPLLPLHGLACVWSVNPFAGTLRTYYVSACGAMTGTVGQGLASNWFALRRRALYQARQFEGQNTYVRMLPMLGRGC